MREMHRSALVPYSAEQMFDLIERVEDYPQFLPWCTTRLINARMIHSATVEVGYRDLHVHVTTRNEKRRPEWMSIHMQGGTFRQFYGEWQLLPLDTMGCRIGFLLRYELALHAERLAGPLIDQAANRMVDAFVQRAESIFGQGASTGSPGQPSGA
jgi:ribosome-associated toxin RatA of RatAB toxin-antitoxin module